MKKRYTTKEQIESEIDQVREYVNELHREAEESDVEAGKLSKYAHELRLESRKSGIGIKQKTLLIQVANQKEEQARKSRAWAKSLRKKRPGKEKRLLALKATLSAFLTQPMPFSDESVQLQKP